MTKFNYLRRVAFALFITIATNLTNALNTWNYQTNITDSAGTTTTVTTNLNSVYFLRQEQVPHHTNATSYGWAVNK